LRKQIFENMFGYFNEIVKSKMKNEKKKLGWLKSENRSSLDGSIGSPLILTCVSWMCMLPWLSGRGGKMIQTSMSWMDVYPDLIVEEDE
jgi:hypothetical protein